MYETSWVKGARKRLRQHQKLVVAILRVSLKASAKSVGLDVTCLHDGQPACQRCFLWHRVLNFPWCREHGASTYLTSRSGPGNHERDLNSAKSLIIPLLFIARKTKGSRASHMRRPTAAKQLRQPVLSPAAASVFFKCFIEPLQSFQFHLFTLEDNHCFCSRRAHNNYYDKNES